MALLDILLYAVMGLLVLTLIAGLVTLWRGSDASRSSSNKLMRARVFLQFLAILILFLGVYVFGR